MTDGDAEGSRGPGDGEGPLFDEGFLRRLEYLHVVARKLLSGSRRAARRSRKIGGGLEYADHRDYAAGDDPRYLDWSAYGRLDKLLVRLFEEEEDLHISILVDASRSMASGTPPKFDSARRLAAALAYIGLGSLDRVSLIPFGGGAREGLPPLRGRGQIFKLLAFLSALSPSGDTDLLAAATACVHRSTRRGIVLVLSDFYDARGYGPALDLLRHHRFEPAVIQIVDDSEARPLLRGDVELVDCETGLTREITVTPRLAAAYARQHRAFSDGLAAFSTARGLPYLMADTRVPFDELVLRLLRERGFVG